MTGAPRRLEPLPNPGTPRAALDAILRHIEMFGYPPTIRELMDRIGKSQTHTHRVLMELQAAGYIEHKRSQPRSITVRFAASGAPVAKTRFVPLLHHPTTETDHDHAQDRHR